MLQVDETLHWRQRRLQHAGLAHELDRSRKTLEVDLALPWQHVALRLKIERQREPGIGFRQPGRLDNGAHDVVAPRRIADETERGPESAHEAPDRILVV